MVWAEQTEKLGGLSFPYAARAAQYLIKHDLVNRGLDFQLCGIWLNLCLKGLVTLEFPKEKFTIALQNTRDRSELNYPLPITSRANIFLTDQIASIKFRQGSLSFII